MPKHINAVNGLPFIKGSDNLQSHLDLGEALDFSEDNGAAAGVISLEIINDEFNFDFDVLDISIADDEWGTRSAILRLLRLYTKAQKYHLHLAPADIGESEIGHFAYFNQKFADSLWPLALRWIQTGSMPDPFQSRILKVG